MMQCSQFLGRTNVAIVVCLGLLGMANSSTAATPAEQRTEVQKMRSTTLERLYSVHPAAKADVQKSAGYAVFSNVGINRRPQI